MGFARLVALGLSLWCGVALWAKPVPQMTRRVEDLAQLLSESQRTRLEQKLLSQEKATSNQIGILTIPTLDGESIEDFANKVANASKLGQKGRDNGVLIVVAKQDHKMRIEVGPGLQGSLTDSLAGQIIQREMKPRFRDGNYYAGLDGAVDKVLLAVKGEYKADSSHGFDGESFESILFMCGVGFVCLISRLFSMGIGLTIGTAFGAFLGYIFFEWEGLVLGAVFGFIGAFVAQMSFRGGGSGSGSSWFSDSSSSSSSSSFGDGGSFDGGGSSGDW